MKNNKRMSYALAIVGALMILILGILLAGLVYKVITGGFSKDKVAVSGHIEGGNGDGAEDRNDDLVEDEALEPGKETYTREEVVELLQEVREKAGKAGTQGILEDIKRVLSGGELTMVEMLRPYYADEIVVVSSGAFHFVPINEALKKNDYKAENLNILESGEIQYMESDQVTSRKGIDVSKFQGEIDWEAVAADGVEYAFIRVGNRGYGAEGKLLEDDMFETNIEGALQAGIKVGVYFYTQAINEEEVLAEADLVLRKIAPYKVECPVVYDVEKVSGANGRMNALSAKERTDLTLLFCETIAEAGYEPMIYYNMEMATLMLELERLEEYEKWFAYYNQDLYFPYDYKIWQYSHTGRVNGIKGEVDMNISFGPIWEE